MADIELGMTDIKPETLGYYSESVEYCADEFGIELEEEEDEDDD